MSTRLGYKLWLYHLLAWLQHWNQLYSVPVKQRVIYCLYHMLARLGHWHWLSKLPSSQRPKFQLCPLLTAWALLWRRLQMCVFYLEETQRHSVAFAFYQTEIRREAVTVQATVILLPTALPVFLAGTVTMIVVCALLDGASQQTVPPVSLVTQETTVNWKVNKHLQCTRFTGFVFYHKRFPYMYKYLGSSNITSLSKASFYI